MWLIIPHSSRQFEYRWCGDWQVECVGTACGGEGSFHIRGALCTPRWILKPISATLFQRNGCTWLWVFRSYPIRRVTLEIRASTFWKNQPVPCLFSTHISNKSLHVHLQAKLIPYFSQQKNNMSPTPCSWFFLFLHYFLPLLIYKFFHI
jgi:hypothetical protein